MSNTAAATAKALADAGIERVFGLPGGEVLVLMDELRKAGIDFVLMRHEANAGLAAAVYGKLRGQPGVVLTTLGPGAANLLLPISSSYLDQEPLLAISAQLPASNPASHTHQLLPLHDVFRPVARFVSTITPANVHEVVPRALAACMEKPFGAAYLTLSAAEAREAVADRAGDAKHPRPPAGQRRPEGDAQKQAKRVRDALRGAKRPLVVVGLSTDPANSARLRRWLNAWGLPVAVTPKIKGIVDETAPNFVGTVGGMAADGVMVEALEAADLVIGFGLDPVELDKTWHIELPILWVLEHPNVAGMVPGDTELASHASLLDVLAGTSPPAIWEAPFRDFQEKRRGLLNHRSQSPGTTMWPGDLIQALASALPPETIVATDVGSHKYLFGQFWPSRQPQTFWMSNGLSAMAYGLSAALGAKLARPDVPVLAAVGDGGFSMNSQELETAERVGAPFVTVVLKDGSYSLIKLSQEGKNLAPYRMDFDPIDSVKVAEACGVRGLRTTDPAELTEAVAGAARENRSLVVEVPINYADYKRLF
jgi:acetolactate synthase-1/2/3 large subunit